MKVLLLACDTLTARHLARAIAEYRARRDELPDGLEDVEFFLLEASREAGEGQQGSGAVTVQAPCQDRRMISEWLTLPEASDVSGLSVSTLKRRICDGSLSSTKVGASRRVNRTALAEFMESGQVAA